MSAADSLNIVEFDGQPATNCDTNWPFDTLPVFSNAEAATESVRQLGGAMAAIDSTLCMTSGHG